MADYGLKIWDATSTLRLDTTDAISRLRYTVIEDAGVDGSVILSDIAGLDTVEFAIALEDNKEPHLVERSGTTINWYDQGGVDSSDSLIVVFLYS